MIDLDLAPTSRALAFLHPRRRSPRAALCSLALVATALTACGDSSGGSDASAGTGSATESTTRGEATDGTAGESATANTTGPSGGETDGQTSAGSAATESTSATDSTGATDSMGATDSTSATAGETEDETTGNICADADVTFEPSIPYIQILVDQSGSMTSNFAGQTRWDAVYNALFDGQDGVVAQYQSQIRFGLSLYTSDGGFNGGECPIISEVAPAIDNGAAMQSLYDMNGPQGDTPTGESIDAVVPTLLGLPDDGPKVIVVATDGEPDTCAEPNPQNGQGVAVTAATNSFDAGVPVYIISVGSDISDQHLQDMANAGLGVQPGDPDAPFWKANEPQALLDAFNTIINGVRDCKLELNGEVQEGKEEECAVEINMQEVPYNDPDGWQLNSPSEIELVGQACDSIQEGEVEVDIKCSCEAFIE